MKRYLLTVYLCNECIFCKDYSSITKVAMEIDHFIIPKDTDIWFDLIDIVKDKSIPVKELMRIWHS